MLGQELSLQLQASALSHPTAEHLHSTAQPGRSSLVPGWLDCEPDEQGGKKGALGFESGQG